MDFVIDAPCDGRRFRVLTIVDDFTRESLTIEVDTSLPSESVVRVLASLAARGLSRAIACGNGSEFPRQAMDQSADADGVALRGIEQETPIQNVFAENVNGGCATNASTRAVF